MTDYHDIAQNGLSESELEAVLRQIGHERYHINHPHHHYMMAGNMSKLELQAWALNRYCYQAAIPRKDAAILMRSNDPEFRAEWRSRIEDHDGTNGKDGGISRWLKLATGLGLDEEVVKSQRQALAATKFAVGAYIEFCRDKTLLEAVASSLTELFSPLIISERVPGMLAKYSFISEETLAYFKPRLTQAPKDSDFALAYVKKHANTPEKQQQVIDALLFKTDILWAMLDALQHAYGEKGHIPPGAFIGVLTGN
ncbi:pyrroloquinoline-quinone synthase PqqC [Bartonella sp. HY038]|uniref:pyrroloquinoline-quinone synthase PqqC n=1 Tax=Bartonella sp. HY038 TaxID=2759660 RepID=UPI0015FA5F9C|nr:pyrroloquinoline-quinone synthase PqqC [Bartonella sp. HY038]